MTEPELHYFSDEQGTLMSVVVPISVWHEIQSELETHHLLKIEAMKRSLLRSRGLSGGVPFDEVLSRLGPNATATEY